MPTNASGTTCTQRLLRLTSCLISAQALRIWSSCSSQLPWQSQQAHLQHLFLRAQLHLPHQHHLHLPEALLRDSDLQLCTGQGSVLFTSVLRQLISGFFNFSAKQKSASACMCCMWWNLKIGERILMFFNHKSCCAQKGTIQTFILLSN